MILVTGGEGYLGGRIVDYLISRKLQVRVGGRVEKEGIVKVVHSDQKSLEKAQKRSEDKSQDIERAQRSLQRAKNRLSIINKK